METYCNPIQKHGDFADPFVLRFNGRYYLYCTNPDVRCWESTDLVHWHLCGTVVPEEEFPGLVPFAPEVVYDNGWFYLYTSPHGFGHYVLRSEKPTGPFYKITPNIGHAIDFSVFIDDDGQWYAYWADDDGILGCRMTSPTAFGEPQYIGAFLHGWTEGPFVVKRDGLYHLTYTGNHFLSKGYRIHGASAKHPLGPFTDYDHNPIAVQTQGAVVGLGHSSTVVGLDLMSDWMLYHNLNPDKTRDLDLDRVLFRGADGFLLGPTTHEQCAPCAPDYQDLFCEESGDDWCLVQGCWHMENGLRVSDCALMALCAYPLPCSGAVEMNLASNGAEQYGLFLQRAETIQRLCIDRRKNCVQLLDKADTLLWQMPLPTGFRHEALHTITLRWDGGIQVHLDRLLLKGLSPAVQDAKVGYFADGAAQFGAVTISQTHAEFCIPPSALAPAESAFTLNLPEGGRYLCSLFGQAAGNALLRVDETPYTPQNRTPNVTTFCLRLAAGTHAVRLQGADGCRIRFDRVDEPSTETLRPALELWDKEVGSLRCSDVEITATLCPAACADGWQAGVLLRAQQLADGGEGDDQQLGTNFFVGYRVSVSAGKLQLWKHQYDQTLLAEQVIPTQKTYALTVRCAADEVQIILNEKTELHYQDKPPIMVGRIGVHSRNCKILKSTSFVTAVSR